MHCLSEGSKSDLALPKARATALRAGPQSGGWALGPCRRSEGRRGPLTGRRTSGQAAGSRNSM
eukprot:13472910-Alexandrium_andersonii.AAC.1